MYTHSLKFIAIVSSVCIYASKSRLLQPLPESDTNPEPLSPADGIRYKCCPDDCQLMQ